MSLPCSQFYTIRGYKRPPFVSFERPFELPLVGHERRKRIALSCQVSLLVIFSNVSRNDCLQCCKLLFGGFLGSRSRSACSRGLLRPLRGSAFGLGQPDDFVAGASPHVSRTPRKGQLPPPCRFNCLWTVSFHFSFQDLRLVYVIALWRFAAANFLIFSPSSRTDSPLSK